MPILVKKDQKKSDTYITYVFDNNFLTYLHYVYYLKLLNYVRMHSDILIIQCFQLEKTFFLYSYIKDKEYIR